MKSQNSKPGSTLPEFPLVGIGASAGGMESAVELIKELPAQTGMAYVYVQHLDPSHESNLVSILGRATSMNVLEVVDQVHVKQNHLYIIPPNKEIELKNGIIEVKPRPEKPYFNMPVNIFFASLAETYREAAVGIILSGSGSDGAIGLKQIKLAGGLTIVQDESARFQSMPKNAIAEGGVDLVLSIKEIAEELVNLSKRKEVYLNAYRQEGDKLIDINNEELRSILRLLLKNTRVDFSLYKMTTINRRIIRRMLLHKLDTLEDYLSYINNHSNEINLLFHDLLINVTSFFRDSETSDFLRKNLIIKILKGKAANDPIRIWVPACSTGQEAYSIAMLFMEVIMDKHPNLPIQIFATDLSEVAVNKARMGIYTEEEVIGVSPKRLQKFFTKIDGSYRIIKAIRDICIFATHNIAKDPPFSKLDLISCCNLLIYLDYQLQKKVLGIFHYSLNSNGFLILGKSESVGSSNYLFSQIDKKYKVFSKKKDAAVKASFEINFTPSELSKKINTQFTPPGKKTFREDTDLEKAVEKLILQKYIPACVVVNADLDILQFRGSTGLYLEPLPGKASLNLMKMARPGLGFELKNIVHKAIKTGEPSKKRGLQININSRLHKVSIEAVPLREETEQDYFLIIFEEETLSAEEGKQVEVKDKLVRQLEAELTTLREDMRSIMESQEAANEELQSANEEIVSSNEELQSINEELETSKEEIESSNEELITINQELQVRNEQLTEANEYSEAVFTTMRESIMVIDKNLRIKSVNTAFLKLFGLNEHEVIGSLVFEFHNKQWNFPAFKDLLDKLKSDYAQCIDFELTHYFEGIGEKILMINAKKIIQQMNRQQLILIAIEDITQFRQSERMLSEREAWFRNMADNAPIMIWFADHEMIARFYNSTWLEFTGMKFEEARGTKWISRVHQEDQLICESLFKKAITDNKSFSIRHRLLNKDNEYKWVLTKVKPAFEADSSFNGFIGSSFESD